MGKSRRIAPAEAERSRVKRTTHQHAAELDGQAMLSRNAADSAGTLRPAGDFPEHLATNAWIFEGFEDEDCNRHYPIGNGHYLVRDGCTGAYRGVVRILPDDS